MVQETLKFARRENDYELSIIKYIFLHVKLGEQVGSP
jgi:hypothetical protein